MHFGDFGPVPPSIADPLFLPSAGAILTNPDILPRQGHVDGLALVVRGHLLGQILQLAEFAVDDVERKIVRIGVVLDQHPESGPEFGQFAAIQPFDGSEVEHVQCADFHQIELQFTMDSFVGGHFSAVVFRFEGRFDTFKCVLRILSQNESGQLHFLKGQMEVDRSILNTHANWKIVNRDMAT